jgi:preprotein translocase subunit SecD
MLQKRLSLVKSLNFRVILFIVAFIFGVVFSVPSLMQSESGKKVTLGLDLQGGVHMLLGVKNEVAIESRIKSTAASVKYLFDDKEIIVDDLHVTESGEIVFELLDGDDVQRVKKLLAKEFESMEMQESGLIFTLTMTEAEKERIKKYAIEQAVDTIRGRLDLFGLSEPTVAKQGEDKILVEVAGIKTAADEQRIRDLIGKTAKLEMLAVDEDFAARVNTMSEDEANSRGDVILTDIKTPEKYLLKAIPILDGSMLTDATVGYGEDNLPTINFTLNSHGAKIFGDFSAKSVGKRMAIVLDGKVYSAPSINERIGGGRGQISGNFSTEEAHDVAIALRSGALLAPVVIEEKRSIGSSLGAESISAASFALIAGFVAVFIFMLVYYRTAGLIANVALLANLFLILAVMSLFGATLTLPGMAGIVLTVGIAVDSNIIINERIRELLHKGVGVRKALKEGYEKAMRAILDSNVTQVLVCVVLYAYGTGAIKGFALTLSIGILASMLTAIVGTYGIYQMLLPRLEKAKSYNTWFGINKDK